MAFVDDVNRILRDFEGYSGDGHGGVGALPVGDRSTAQRPISKRDLRVLLVDLAQNLGDPSALQDILSTVSDLSKPRVYQAATISAAIAQGVAALAVGQTFTAVGDDVDYIGLYKKTGASTSTEIAKYPTAQKVSDNSREIANNSKVVEVSLNIFDKDAADFLPDHFVSWLDGSTPASADYDATGFMDVEGGETYHFSHTNTRLAWYTEDRTFISGLQTGSGDIVAPAAAHYLRASFYTVGPALNKNTFYVKKGAGPFVTYQNYGAWVRPVSIKEVNGAAVTDRSLPLAKMDFATPSKNLFDKSAATIGYFAAANGNLVADAQYAISDYIPVEVGKTYYGKSTVNMRFWAAYDINKNVVAGAGSNSGGAMITVPVGVSYYRVTFYVGGIDVFQFEEGSSQTSYAPFGYTLDNVLGLNSEGAWQGKKFVSYGDSITAQNSWQTHVRSALVTNNTVLGVGGRQISGTAGMNTQSNVDTIPADADLLIVMGGVNDWAQSRILGAEKSINIEEFNGALNVMLERLLTRLPTCRIMLATPTFSLYPDGNWESRGGWISGILNNKSLGTVDYAAAVRAAGVRWGLPVIDIAAEEGTNRINIDTYRIDDGGRLHPNTAGGKKIASVVIGRLRALEPVV